jgi:Protein of unknown function (DUF1579)
MRQGTSKYIRAAYAGALAGIALALAAPLAGCAAPAAQAPPLTATKAPIPSDTPAKPEPQANPPEPPSKACAAPENRQLDFWLGEWDLTLRARKSPTSDEWDEAKATNQVRSRYGGCVIEESFAAAGPESPWAGMSVSTYLPQAMKWRQTWVDDQGNYIALSGGWQDGKMTLYGEPRAKDGKTIQMRMVFSEIRPDHLYWTWERTEDGGGAWTPMMTIQYTRKR